MTAMWGMTNNAGWLLTIVVFVVVVFLVLFILYATSSSYDDE